VPPFVSAEVADWRAASQLERERLGLPTDDWTWPRAPLPGESAETAAEQIAHEKVDLGADDGFSRWLAEHPRPEATLSQVVDHIEHAREVAGIDHIGLGGDYDGVDHQTPDLADVSTYPRLLQALAERHWSSSDLAALTGLNVLRVLRAAEETATEPLWPTAALR
jgi:membrane dipeptidase